MTVPRAVQLLRDRTALQAPSADDQAELAVKVERRAIARAASHEYAQRLRELIRGQEHEALDLVEQLDAAIAAGESISDLLIEATIAWPLEALQASTPMRHVA